MAKDAMDETQWLRSAEHAENASYLALNLWLDMDDKMAIERTSRSSPSPLAHAFRASDDFSKFVLSF